MTFSAVYFNQSNGAYGNTPTPATRRKRMVPAAMLERAEEIMEMDWFPRETSTSICVLRLET